MTEKESNHPDTELEEGKIEQEESKTNAHETLKETEAQLESAFKEAADEKSATPSKWEQWKPYLLKFREPKVIYTITFIYILLFLIILLWKLIAFRRSKVEYETPIGYIWNMKFKNEIIKYINQRRHDQFVIVHGPKGYGKTRGIRVLSSELISEGRTPFIFDFQKISKTATKKDARKVLQSQLLMNLMKIDGRTIDIPMAKAVQLLTPLTVLKETVPKTIHFQFKDQNLQKIASLLLQIAYGFERNPATTMNNLFEAIDALAALRPVIFIVSPEILLNNNHKEISDLYTSILQNLRSFAEAYKSTPTVTEISDQTLVPEILTIPSCRALYLGELQFEEVESLSNDKYFNLNDVKKIYNKFGGYGGAFATIRDNRRDGIPIQSTIDEIDFSDKEWLSTVVYSSKNVKKTVAYLKDVASVKKDVLYNPENEECFYLVKSGIISILEDNKRLTFQSKSLKALFDSSSF
ncbi:hypothetical protein TVAG_190360 [Trichomonas vaginalis G3]|uniref:ATPase domain-containing protein n=1 Tax=Trichomonas vaginalis (strain ATCC PRA-98 / G3) TaxID=412133 RepID=A2DKG4_TRIV3|nr:P-loop containing nucleoside triphosphate hydrolases family [Trichomonas vaginalis G3]EAY19141.1 hypothetical protein TVAG_190360 [Trichomonas vaginalis G3]KAI5490438.1 P-loop containing nucleoside triphosphate hydrolases family [Trichomonas vaginalis G3]|eukprot:XP_001580127.1 hypothetical protein [Trichomonas vaginalis G3]